MGTIVSSFNTLVSSAFVTSTDLMPIIWRQSSGSLCNRVVPIDTFKKGTLRYTRLQRLLVQSCATLTTQPVIWTSVDLDVNSGCRWASASGSLVYVPLGANAVEIKAQIEWASGNANTSRSIEVWKNNGGNRAVGGMGKQSMVSGGTSDVNQNLSSGIIPVNSGDYFELIAFHVNGSNLNFATNSFAMTWMDMKVIY
jgi:hypothetical protein